MRTRRAAERHLLRLVTSVELIYENQLASPRAILFGNNRNHKGDKSLPLQYVRVDGELAQARHSVRRSLGEYIHHDESLVFVVMGEIRGEMHVHRF